MENQQISLWPDIGLSPAGTMRHTSINDFLFIVSTTKGRKMQCEEEEEGNRKTELEIQLDIFGWKTWMSIFNLSFWHSDT